MPRSRRPTDDTSAPAEVRYYPRRVAVPAPPMTLTPSQALHLESDPARAARARRTEDARSYRIPPSRPLLRWWRRLRRRSRP